MNRAEQRVQNPTHAYMDMTNLSLKGILNKLGWENWISAKAKKKKKKKLGPYLIPYKNQFQII